MKNVILQLFLLLPIIVFSQPMSETFNSSGTWVCPVGYTANITVEAWGGGGSGGTGGGRQGGGGGGAYSSSTFDVVAGSYTITVGAGGNVGPGGSSSFGSTVIALGGGTSASSTGSGNGGSAAGSTGTTKFSGGNGGIPGSGTNGGGGGGGSATSIANGNPGAPSVGGIGGAGGTGEGDGGKGANTSGANPAIAGVSPGGGGGGRASTTNTTSANGAAGLVIVTVNSFILPVELVFLKTNLTSKSILLSFQTASELNNSHFSIERSTDGQNYREIGFVQGNGTSYKTNDYEFTDENPAAGINYYRLKQVDFDGKFEYSKVVSVRFGETQGPVRVYPTIASGDMLSIELASLPAFETSIAIFDQNGKQLRSLVMDSETDKFQVEVGDLPSGAYLMRIINGQTVETARFIRP